MTAQISKNREAAVTLLAKLPMIITAFTGNKYKRNFALRHMRAIGQPKLKEHIGMSVREVIEIDENIPFDKELYEAIYSENNRSLETFQLIRAIYDYKENSNVQTPMNSITPEAATLVSRLCIGALRYQYDNLNDEEIKDEALFTLLNLVAYRLNGTRSQVFTLAEHIVNYLNDRSNKHINRISTTVFYVITEAEYEPRNNVTDNRFILETRNEPEEAWEKNETYRFSPNAMILFGVTADLDSLYDTDVQSNCDKNEYDEDKLDAIYAKVFYRYTQNKVSDIYDELNHLVCLDRDDFTVI